MYNNLQSLFCVNDLFTHIWIENIDTMCIGLDNMFCLLSLLSTDKLRWENSDGWEFKNPIKSRFEIIFAFP